MPLEGNFGQLGICEGLELKIETRSGLDDDSSFIVGTTDTMLEE
jgi:hypothetical protein